MAERMMSLAKEIFDELDSDGGPKNESAEFVRWFRDTSKNLYLLDYVVYWEKDCKLVKILLKTYTMDALKKRAVAFFESQDPFIKQAGFTIGVFYAVINKLAAQQKDDLPIFKLLKGRES